MGEPNYITRDGYQKLLRELEQLGNVERPRVVQEVADAAAQGDRSENAEYIYGKRRLREIDKRMRFLSQRLENIQVVEATNDQRDRVFFGASVEVEDDDGKRKTYKIVGEDEVEPSAGRISWKSPLGRALMKKKAGDDIAFERPDGTIVELVLVKYWY